ncbi:VWA domain-containing protein [Aureibacter tunicatorum]|uniref:Uncharacterized protein with von Willebrand factor type A (VWA) domain n=1 Tax=Aureibacter tunicatorum TaxID=866807 RepID=A0AAE3XJK5_9BACT|nr:VWA domain-containing protein [Aureibacter tunicatorum]MDR6238926.1 uncharacterized protein with von Willebrand factor type A (vWA) domain [Aureibacter tunicatorum]BDD05147.1 hypothetical protein AUTU_26300 [Aureibacter tunicatorum]
MENLVNELLEFKFFGMMGEISEREMLSDYLMHLLKVGEFGDASKIEGTFEYCRTMLDTFADTPELKDAFVKYPDIREEFVRDLLIHNQKVERIHRWLGGSVSMGHLSMAMVLPAVKFRFLASAWHKAGKWINRLLKFLARLTQGADKAMINYHSKKFQRNLRKKVKKYDQAVDSLDPFISFLGSFDKEGTLQKVDFDIEKHCDMLLQKELFLKELSEILGQINTLERQAMIEDLDQVELGSIKTKCEFSKEEITDIFPGDRLDSVLPVELAYLSEANTERVFYQKYVEKRLLSYKFEGSVVKPEMRRSQREETSLVHEKGPVVICLDSSASMMGKAELYAKSIGMYILRQAYIQGRKCYLVTFAKKVLVKEIDPKTMDLDAIIILLKQSFHGGTDINSPMEECLNILRKKDYEDADVLIITDGQLPALKDRLRSQVESVRRKGNRFLHLAIANQSYAKKWTCFDADIHFHPNRKDNLKKLVLKLRSMAK